MAESEYFVRFSLRRRIEHAALIVTFTTLVVTGLTQKFYTAGVAEWLILHLGGIETVRIIHRIFAAIFTLSVLYHLVSVTYDVLVRHSRLTMIPTRKDFADVLDYLKYTIGFRKEPPQYGRYNYRQTFEYWGMMFGSTIIIVTGFVLAFPIAVTRFLPGQVVVASVVFHGWEATLALLTILVWHVYEAFLKPGVFPGDFSIFTGKISKEEMLEEHGLEYAEIASEKLEPVPVEVVSEQIPPAPPSEIEHSSRPEDQKLPPEN
ncbi:MAG: cytochrome b/b6 domain-containing protein [Chloroflexota bacterium]